MIAKIFRSGLLLTIIAILFTAPLPAAASAPILADAVEPAGVQLAGSAYTAIVAGDYHTCVLTNWGGVSCWGWNNHGQLGDGTLTDRLSPVGVSGLTSSVTAIVAGGAHTCALTDAGGVKCWGDNAYGQLGNASLVDSSTPVEVSGLTSGVSAIAAGWDHTCALTNSGVKCWGDNSNNQLGQVIPPMNKTTPVDVSGLNGLTLTAIAAGGNHTCVLSNTGGVKCWGYNSNGQLGNGSTTNSATPVDVNSMSGLTAIAIAAGGYHACALTSAGVVKCWGANTQGQLGDASSLSGLSMTGIAAGWYHTCALTSAGGVKCWGDNGYGQLGDDTTADRSTPADVLGLTSGVSAIAAGYEHTCALTTAGKIKCWGRNRYGELGDDTTTQKNTPVDVFTLTISGKVTLLGTDDHSGVTLRCGAYTGNSSENGTYAITNLVKGTSCTVTPVKAGYEFDTPPISATVTALSADLVGVNFTGRPLLQGVVPATSINGASPAFQWLDGNLTPGWYQLVLENDPKGQGLWSPLADFWYEAGAPDVCRINNSVTVCRAYPYKALAAGYYRWRLRSSNRPLVWSAYKNFQVKKAVYAPRGAQGTLPAAGSVEFRWAEMDKVFNLGKANGGKQSIKASQYRILLLSGKKKLLDSSTLWYSLSGSDRVVTCAESVCSITLNNTDFSASLAAGNYLWKVVPKYTYDYNAGKGTVAKTVVGAPVTGETFSFNAPAPSTPLVMDKVDMTATSVSGVSEPYFTWVAPAELSKTDKYEVTIEQMNPVSGAWKKVKGGEFSIGTPKVVKKVDVFRCTAGAGCIYYPGGAPTWKAGLYRWAVRYVTYPGKITSPYASGLTAGVAADDPNAGIFRVKEPFFTPQPVGPSGANSLPQADGLSPVFTWEADPSESVLSGKTGSKYVLTVTTPKGKFSVDVAPDACVNTLCSYTLSGLPDSMSKKYPAGSLDYGAYSFSVKVGLLKAAGLEPTVAKNWAYGKESAKRPFSYGPRPVTDLVVTQTVTTKNPQISWTDADPDNTTGFQVLVERYDTTKGVWLKVAAATLLKSKAGVCNGTSCAIDFSKAKPWWKVADLTYRVRIMPFKTKPVNLGPAVIQEFVLPLK